MDDCDFSLNINSGNDDFVWPSSSQPAEEESAGFSFNKKSAPKAKVSAKQPVGHVSSKTIARREASSSGVATVATPVSAPAPASRPIGRARLLAQRSSSSTATKDYDEVVMNQRADLGDVPSGKAAAVGRSSSAALPRGAGLEKKQKKVVEKSPGLDSRKRKHEDGNVAASIVVAAVAAEVSDGMTSDKVLSFENEPPSKPKFKTLTEAEDPHQYHAKPRDLASKDSLLRPTATVSGSDYIFSDSSFSSLSLDSRISEVLVKPRSEGGFGLSTATRCQQMSLPLLLQRQNVLIRSETGSGKTLAYLLPIVNDLVSMSPKVSRTEGTRAIVIAPTRELCAQISGVYEELSKACVWLVGGCLSGGEKKKSEKARLRKGVCVLVSTPGRLLDHLKTTECFDLTGLRWVVFDEADRLLDMGFEQTILEILSIVRGEDLEVLKERASVGSGKASKNDKHKVATSADKGGNVAIGLNKRWQQHSSLMAKKCTDVSELSHIMASATLTGAVRRLAGPVMGDRDFVVVDADGSKQQPADTKAKSITASAKTGSGSDNVLDFTNDDDAAPQVENIMPTPGLSLSGFDNQEHVEAPKQLAQYFMHVTCKWRLAALLSFLKQHSHQKVMVFFSTCDSVDYHSLLLKEAEWPEQLDESVATDEAGINHSKDVLEPPAAQFTGIFGSKCKMYRLHGSIPQRTRQEAFKSFCDAKAGVMLCTDVAARGLDLPHVDWILQYDPPCETTDYVHRIGRTARRGLGGSALIFLLPSEAGYMNLLSSHGLNPAALSLQGLFMDTVSHVSGASKFKNSDEMCAVILQRRMERTAMKNKYLTGAGRQAYRSFIRAYATHSSDSKGIFQVQLLHLGHLAKSFALSENITSLRNHEDMISKIMNGMFTAAVLSSADTAEAKKAARNQKYSLSGGKKSLPDGRSGNRHNDASEFSNKRRRDDQGADGGDSKRSRPENEVERGEGTGKHSIKNRKAQEKASTQKVRKMGKPSANDTGGSKGSSSALAPSGRFRKTTGYFKKQLRSQSTFEFSG